MNQQLMMEKIVETAVSDPRIVAVVDYGSSVEGRADKWSDVDVGLFIKDDQLANFDAHWKTWAAQFGNLRLAYKGGVGHPWGVYDALPLPLRVDFHFVSDSELTSVQTWPKAPTSVEVMVKYDATANLQTL